MDRIIKIHVCNLIIKYIFDSSDCGETSSSAYCNNTESKHYGSHCSSTLASCVSGELQCQIYTNGTNDCFDWNET